jgi:hypothetical protein
VLAYLPIVAGFDGLYDVSALDVAEIGTGRGKRPWDQMTSLGSLARA